jgi:hypothetical protein
MKSAKVCWLLVLCFVLASALLVQAQNRLSFRGTVVRMQMSDCAPKGFVVMMSGAPGQAGFQCPAYTVVSDKVVYLIVARRSDEFIPLAESLDFLVRKNELLLFSEDEKSRSRFSILQMTMRSDWDREQSRKEMTQRALEQGASFSERERPRAAVMATAAAR